MKKEIDLTDYMTIEEFRAKIHAYIEERSEVLARRLRKDWDDQKARNAERNRLVTK